MCIQAFCNVTMDFALGNLIEVPLVKSRTSPPRNKHRQNERKSPLKMRIFSSCHLSSSILHSGAAFYEKELHQRSIRHTSPLE